MQLTSPAFASGTRLPARFVLDGENHSPPLAWSGVPSGTRSLIVLCDDPDAPRGTWPHWALYDLSPDTESLPEGFSGSAAVPPAREAINDLKRAGYDGPAPPPGHGTHHYRFRLLALEVARLELPRGAGCAEVEAAARRHLIEEAELVGTYSR